jgi:hypothetical protein
MQKGKKKADSKSSAEGTGNPKQQPSHVRNQNESHDVRKVSLGPNTKR